MGKKFTSILFTAGVLLLSVTLAVGVLFAGPSPAGANEILSADPAFVQRDGSLNFEVLRDFGDWFSDHFFLRQQLISVNNALFAKVLSTSDSEDVILGKDSWLYYAPTLSDYTGVGGMSEEELNAAVRNLSLMQEYCASQGKEFLFVIAPNKNSLYPEHMPSYGRRAAESNASKLLERMKEQDISHVDLFAVFSEEEETLYFAHDSHWNSKGAALAADNILAAFGQESSYYSDDFSRREPHTGDLYEMMYPSFSDTETNPVYGGTFSFTYGRGGKQPDSISISTQSEESGSLLAYRDSFGNLLYPYLAASFGDAYFSRSVSYDLTREGKCVMIELVERNLRQLITEHPVMPAPARTLSLPDMEESAISCIVQDGAGDMIQVTGTLPTEFSGDDPVYLVCQETAYEAFRVENNGFYALLPGDAAPSGVAVDSDGTCRLFPLSAKE